MSAFLTPAMVEKFGVSFFFAVVVITMIISLFNKFMKIIERSNVNFNKLIESQNEAFTSGFNSVAGQMEKISQMVGKTQLDKDDITELLTNTFAGHIEKKVSICRTFLEENDIINRRAQIEKALSTDFLRITRDECRFLDRFNSKCGCIGTTILTLIDWDVFMAEIYDPFFSANSINKKLDDIRAIMDKYVCDIVYKITATLR